MTALKEEGKAYGAAQGKECLQLIDGEGALDETGLYDFARHVRLADCGISYAVVAIVGPQSSGKSTLLNHLFKTSFREMDAFAGRTQTTQGVWIARAAGIQPCTIVMDLEGTDGRERGEDDTTFEKQSALFALAVADILLINIWCHDIGREHASNKPLLKLVFQVMMRLFTPRKTTLLFVIRDKTRTPLSVLEPILLEDLRKIWESAPRPENYEGTPLSDCFNVQVTALSNFEEKPEVFKDQVEDLREQFQNSIVAGGLAGDRRAVVPGTGFPVSTCTIWHIIKENKDLDLPAHKVMVATVRCEEIAHDKLREFRHYQDWIDLNESSKAGAVQGFGAKISVIVDKFISEYNQEVSYFDEGVRIAKGSYLVSEALMDIKPAYDSVVFHHRIGTLNSFKQELRKWADSPDVEQGFAVAVRVSTDWAMSEFDKAIDDSQVSHAQWDVSKFREKLQRDIHAHAATVRAGKIDTIFSSSKKYLEEKIRESTRALLDIATPDTWPSIREVLSHEVQIAQADLLTALSGYELDEPEQKTFLEDLAKFSRSVVENEAKKEAEQALLRMKDRFTTTFSHDAEALPRVWSARDDIRAVALAARSQSLKGLSIVAAIRLDEKTSDGIEPALCTLLGDSQGTLSKSIASGDRSLSFLSSNPLAATSWEGVSLENTLLTPVQCKNIWRQFKLETDYSISQALAAQEAEKNRNSGMPPIWALIAMGVLGFNEFMALLRNPLYLLAMFVVYLLAKAFWVQLDFGAEFQHGFMPGLLGIATKLLPSVLNMLTRLAQAGSPGQADSSTSSSPPNRSTELQNFAHELDYSSGTDSNGSRNGQPRKRVALAS